MIPNKNFYFSSIFSPTYFNLRYHLLKQGWEESSPDLAQFTDKNLDFNEEAAQTLEYKHLLTNLVTHYCPEIMPLTFCINDRNWTLVLDKIRKIKTHSFWILKPSLLNNGQSIKIFNDIESMVAHFASNQRLGGEHVLQQYITTPHLLRDRRKYSIRQFIILTNYAGAYLYREGYFNVALSPYSLDEFSHLASHLTNEHLHGYEPNVIQIPSNRFDWYEPIYLQIEAMSKRLLLALQHKFPCAFKLQKQKVFALFGVDFLVDARGKVWLLEANHGPCFPVEPTHPLQAYLYEDFWRTLVENFVIACIDSKQAIESPLLTLLL